MFDFDLDLNFDFDFDNKTPKKIKEVEAKESIKIDEDEIINKKTRSIKRSLKHVYRRAFSETRLLDIIPENLEKGNSYHFITAGDVDGLSYLRLVLRKIGSLDYVLFSTWCMALEDVLELKEWVATGKIKKIDAYVGEIFPGTYWNEYKHLKEFITPEIGRIAVFRNHSKIWAGKKDDFYFACEMSCNINTNPRTENGNLIIDEGAFNFYKDFFDGIISIK